MKNRILLVLFALSTTWLPANANVLGDMQTFAPNSDGLDFITVHTSRPLLKGWFATGGHFSFAKDHLVVFKDFDTQDRYRYKDQLVEFDLDIAYAFTERFSVFFAAPNLLYQESDKDQPVDVEVSKGVHTYRPGFKWTIGDGPYQFAFVPSMDIMNVTNSPYTGTSRNPVYNIEFAKTFALANKVAYGVNVGYRIRQPGERPDDGNMFPLDDQITFSVGRSADLFKKSRWVLEGIFSIPVNKSPYKNTEDASSIDLLLGFKHRILRNLNFDWGGTVEPIDTQAPAWRVFMGLVYYFNPGWSDNKNVDRPPPAAPPAEPIGDNVRGEEDVENEVDDGDIDPLTVTPPTAEVFTGEVMRFTVMGGQKPYTYRVLQGRGRLNGPAGFYRAPLQPEVARIEVTDRRMSVRVIEIVVVEPPIPNETIRIKNLNFIFNTDILVPASRAEIDRIVRLFQERKVKRIIVEGHTDSKGSNEYNMALSERRAQAVRRVFVRDLGINEDQVTAIGFGEERPIRSNATDAGRLQNRRVDLKIYYN